MKNGLFFFILLFSFSAQGQDDVPVIKVDTIISTAPVFPDSFFRFNVHHSEPKRAALYSALLPGLGQVYNKQYWKLGLVAGGAGAAAYFIHFNNSRYKKYRAAYITRIDNDPNTNDEFQNLYQNDDLNTLQKQYRQFLEYTIVFTTVGYTLNVLDAYIAANLKTFDMTDDLSLSPRPTFENNQLGIALVLKLK